MQAVLAFAQSHPQAMLIAAIVALYAAYKAWEGGLFSRLKLPSLTREPDVRADLDAMLGVLARAKKRQSIVATHAGLAVEALVKELTA